MYATPGAIRHRATGTSGKTAPGRATSDGTTSATATASVSKAPPITPRTIPLNFIPVDADSSPRGCIGSPASDLESMSFTR